MPTTAIPAGGYVNADNLDKMTIELARAIVLMATDREEGIRNASFQFGRGIGYHEGRADMLREQAQEWVTAQRAGNARGYRVSNMPTRDELDRARYDDDQRVIRYLIDRLPHLPDTRLAWIRNAIQREADQRRRRDRPEAGRDK